MSIRLRSRRGPIGSAWYAVAMRTALEQSLAVDRVRGGKAMAREGRVQWIDISPGTVRAEVRGDLGEEHRTRIDVRRLPEGDREVFAMVARWHPELAATLLAGDYPERIENQLDEHEIRLVPDARAGFSYDCDCGVYPGPCAHVAALAYVVVEKLEAEPVQLLNLRGLTVQDVVPTAPERSAAASGGQGDGAALGDAAPDDAAPDGAAADAAGAAEAAADGSADGATVEDPAEDDAAADGTRGGRIDMSRADASLLVETMGAEAARVIARFYGCPPPDAPRPPDMEPGRSIEG